MDTLVFLRGQMDFMHQLVGAALVDIDEAQLNWSPPGTLTPISTILLHLAGTEDRFITAIQAAGQTIWQVGNWSSRLGVTSLPVKGGDWSEFKHLSLPLAPLMEYLRSVQSVTRACLASLVEEALTRSIAFGETSLPVVDLLSTLVVHGSHHAGEIASLRGVQGVRGLPF